MCVLYVCARLSHLVLNSVWNSIVTVPDCCLFVYIDLDLYATTEFLSLQFLTTDMHETVKILCFLLILAHVSQSDGQKKGKKSGGCTYLI